jgi:6-phosphogluconolactonase
MNVITRLYVGTYTEDILFGTGQVLAGKGKGIYVFDVDPQTGILTPGPVAEGVRNPSYVDLSPDGRFLYAVNELKEFQGGFGGGLSAFSVDPRDGGLAFLNDGPTGGTDPCHVTVDQGGSTVFVANFASGSVCSYRTTPDGRLGERIAFVQHEGGSGIDAARQSGPHAHAVVLDEANGLVWVPDLGRDEIVVYTHDPSVGSLTLRPDRVVKADPGAGPRHFVVRPDGKYAYLVNELASSVTVLARGSDGGMMPIQTYPTLPEDFRGHNSCADIRISPDGRFLYASNRGHDSIAVFRTDTREGLLDFVGTVSSGGKIPRSFSLDPSGRFLTTANQDTDNLVVYRIDGNTGMPGEMIQEIAVGTPVCLRYAVFSRD